MKRIALLVVLVLGFAVNAVAQEKIAESVILGLSWGMHKDKVKEIVDSKSGFALVSAVSAFPYSYTVEINGSIFEASFYCLKDRLNRIEFTLKTSKGKVPDVLEAATILDKYFRGPVILSRSFKLFWQRDFTPFNHLAVDDRWVYINDSTSVFIAIIAGNGDPLYTVTFEPVSEMVDQFFFKDAE